MMNHCDENALNSSFIEKMIEHAFISEITQEAWIGKDRQLEVLRAEVDNSGYDIVLSCNNVTRYIQLKTSNSTSKTSKQNLNLSLSKKENGCIVWVIRNTNRDTNRYAFRYRFFGLAVGDGFPNTDKYRNAKHTKGNSKGVKNVRTNIVQIPKNEFIELDNSKMLLERLFNL